MSIALVGFVVEFVLVDNRMANSVREQGIFTSCFALTYPFCRLEHEGICSATLSNPVITVENPFYRTVNRSKQTRQWLNAERH